MTTFTLTVVAIENKSAVSAKGKPYQLVELAYKNNTFQNKLESAKINQYSAVWGVVSGMKAGEVYTVEKEKDASGYYQWLKATQAAPGQALTASAPESTYAAGPKPTPVAATRSTYE